MNYDIQAVIQKNPPLSEEELLLEQVDTNLKIALLSQAFTLDDYNMGIYLDDGRVFGFSVQGYTKRKQSNYYTQHYIYQRTEAANKDIWAFERQSFLTNAWVEDWIVLSSPLISMRTNQMSGIIVYEIPITVIQNSFTNSDFPGYMYVLDNQDNIVFSYGNSDVMKQGVWYSKTLDNGWLLNIYLSKNFDSGSFSFFYFTLTILFLFLLAAVSSMVRYIKKTITDPLEALIEQMKSLDNTLPSHGKAVDSSVYEVICLYEGYNQMLQHLNRLIENIKLKEREIHRAQFAALQVQINPHFLYNCLDVIAWQIHKNDSAHALSTLLDFSKYFRLNLNMGKAIVCIRDELECTRLYLSLMSTRYKQQISFDIAILNPEVNDYYCYKMILQPIVENSITHGILPTSTQTGYIRITVFLENDLVGFEIYDNGIGVPLKTLQKLNAAIADPSILEHLNEIEPDHGYGLKNIISRFQLLGCDTHKITIESESGSFTRIIVKIPVMIKEEL